MGIFRVIIAVLLLMLCACVGYGIILLVVSFFGLLFDDLTGTHTYLMWSFS